MTSSAPYSTTQHSHTPPARDTYRVGERVHVLGSRRATVITATDARGFCRVLPDDGTPVVPIRARSLVPITTVSNVKTSELLAGDIVATGAGWAKITSDGRSYDGGTVYAFDSVMLALAERIAAGSDTARFVRGTNSPDRPADHWTIQGNDLARWTIEARP